MAQALTCDMCGQEVAATMQTTIENGDVIAIGPSCIIIFYLTAAAEMLGMMPAENVKAYAAAIGAVVDRLVQFDPRSLEEIGGSAPLEYDEDPITGDMVPVTADGMPVSGPESNAGALGADAAADGA